MSEQFIAAGPSLFPPKFDNPYCFLTLQHSVHLTGGKKEKKECPVFYLSASKIHISFYTGSVSKWNEIAQMETLLLIRHH